MGYIKRPFLFLSLHLFLLLSTNVFAGPVIDHIRNVDLNDYALGMVVSVSQNPYIGSKNSAFAYPFLSSFLDSAFTDRWLIIREGNLGLRWANDNWEIGVLGRVQTLSLGGSRDPSMEGLNERKWGLEMAPMVGWRGGPVHINFKTYTELSGHHDGTSSHLDLSWPKEWSRGYIIPSIEAIYQSDDYANYYFGVSPAESNAWRPEYETGSTLNTVLKFRWGYQLSDKWMIKGNVKMEYLDSAITNSPIVEEEHLWSTSVGLAYNANIFQARKVNTHISHNPSLEFRVSMFNDSIDSKIKFNAEANVPVYEIDLEDTLGLEDHATVMQFDTTIRIGTYHRIDIGFFEVERTGQVTLEQDLVIGGQRFSSNTQLNSKLETRIFRTAYSYSLMRDSQKELAFIAGLHYSKFRVDANINDGKQEVLSNHSTPLPTIGIQGSISLGQHSSLSARAELFRLSFDRYEGSFTYLTLDIQRTMGKNFNIGLAYNWYKTKLNADDLKKGSFEIRHQGPSLYLSAFI